MPLIERQRDAAVSTVVAALSMGGLWLLYMKHGAESIMVATAIGAVGLGVWTITYLARGEGED